MTSFMIGPHKSDRDGPPLFIAEAGLAHFGSLSKAVSLIHFAAQAGADFIKFQHFHPDDLYALDGNREMKRRAEERALSDSHMYILSTVAKSENITFLCTPHTEQALSFLIKECEVPAIKIGSGEVGNLPFLRKVRETGLPILLSLGMHKEAEIKAALKIFKDSRLCLMHCVSQYPTPSNELRLGRISILRKTYPHLPIGYSHHGIGHSGIIGAAVLGACIVEQHTCLTEDKVVEDSADIPSSYPVEHLKESVVAARQAYLTLFTGSVPSLQEELTRHWAKKVVVTTCSIMKGATLEPNEGPQTAMKPSAYLSSSARKCGRTSQRTTPSSKSMLILDTLALRRIIHTSPRQEWI